MHQMEGLQNPMQSLLQQYPQLQAVVALNQQKGVSFKQIAEIMAQQQGVDLNALVRQLQS